MNAQAREMAAFDRLPMAVRNRLSGSRFNFKAGAIASERRLHRLSLTETLALLDELELWAAEAERNAKPIDGNRIGADRPPNVEAMVDRIRGLI